MTDYVFDAIRGDGFAEAWDYAAVDDDAAALGYAERVLNDHPSATCVSVFDGERRVGEIAVRGEAGARRALHGCAILVLEDRFLIAEDLRRLLHEAGAEVMGPFADAAPALAAARQCKPSCAIIDINLGAGPNFEAAEALVTQRVPIVFVTGYDAEVVPETLSHAPHLRKPVRGAELVAALEALCAQGSTLSA